MTNGQIVSCLLLTTLLTSCQTMPRTVGKDLAEGRTNARYKQEWEKLEAEKGKPPIEFRRLFADALNDIIRLRTELKKGRTPP